MIRAESSAREELSRRHSLPGGHHLRRRCPCRVVDRCYMPSSAPPSSVGASAGRRSMPLDQRRWRPPSPSLPGGYPPLERRLGMPLLNAAGLTLVSAAVLVLRAVRAVLALDAVLFPTLPNINEGMVAAVSAGRPPPPPSAGASAGRGYMPLDQRRRLQRSPPLSLSATAIWGAAMPLELD